MGDWRETTQLVIDFIFFLQGLAILTVLKIMFVNLKTDNFILMQYDKLVVVKKKKNGKKW